MTFAYLLSVSLFSFNIRKCLLGLILQTETLNV